MTSTPTAPRTRKSPAERRDEIERAARELALEQGLAALTLRAVAARAGVVPGLVAHYVTGMDDLVAATFSAIVADELAEVHALVRREPAVARRIGALVDTVLHGGRDDVTLVWVQGWALGPANAALAAAVREQMDAWHTMIVELISDGVDAGAFVVDDAHAAAWHLLAMIDGLNAHSLVRWHDAPDRRDMTLRVVAALLGAETAAIASPITTEETA
ncbi:TetR/AcrR family transcriptional regulator [Schumannella sp. 10F1B-5-1]|uniref:TetR/AcrR family transcriptional regulator n=1 Tax=Schumannella sp. 10F1B-5-1 TaxID=2590780 RepID=UPI001131EFE3|nr:TetR family transcriptional regulator C-terminal domain-containing protein [Schumannella sp. 10F1B-5-1]TPW71685.1 TetR family transcriptional regulator [Schumannella sp. 10F1B-5-1]